MAQTSKHPKHSGFEGPVRGIAYPRGTTYRKNKDGTSTPVFPKNKKSK